MNNINQNNEEITNQLEMLNAGSVTWKKTQNALKTELKFPNFIQAFSFMTAVAMIAEKMNHHPEWSNVYNRVSIVLTTHTTSSITNLDIELAGKINKLAEKFM